MQNNSVKPSESRARAEHRLSLFYCETLDSRRTPDCSGWREKETCASASRRTKQAKRISVAIRKIIASLRDAGQPSAVPMYFQWQIVGVVLSFYHCGHIRRGVCGGAGSLSYPSTSPACQKCTTCLNWRPAVLFLPSWRWLVSQIRLDD